MFALHLYLIFSPVASLCPASQKTCDLGVCRSYQMALPSALKNSCTMISISIVRV